MTREQAAAHIIALDGLEERIRNTALATTDIAVLLRLSSEQAAIRAARAALAGAYGPPLALVR